MSNLLKSVIMIVGSIVVFGWIFSLFIKLLPVIAIVLLIAILIKIVNTKV